MHFDKSLFLIRKRITILFLILFPSSARDKFYFIISPVSVIFSVITNLRINFNFWFYFSYPEWANLLRFPKHLKNLIIVSPTRVNWVSLPFSLTHWKEDWCSKNWNRSSHSISDIIQRNLYWVDTNGATKKCPFGRDVRIRKIFRSKLKFFLWFQSDNV